MRAARRRSGREVENLGALLNDRIGGVAAEVMKLEKRIEKLEAGAAQKAPDPEAHHWAGRVTP